MKTRRLLLLGLLAACLALTSGASAGASPNYRLDWHNRLTGSGAQAGSPAYKMNLTVGQSLRGTAASPGYQAALGYWAGSPGLLLYGVYVPSVQR